MYLRLFLFVFHPTSITSRYCSFIICVRNVESKTSFLIQVEDERDMGLHKRVLALFAFG